MGAISKLQIIKAFSREFLPELVSAIPFFGTALKSGVKGAFDKMDELEKESASKEEMNKELKVVVENEEKLDEAEAKELINKLSDEEIEKLKNYVMYATVKMPEEKDLKFLSGFMVASKENISDDFKDILLSILEDGSAADEIFEDPDDDIVEAIRSLGVVASGYEIDVQDNVVDINFGVYVDEETGEPESDTGEILLPSNQAAIDVIKKSLDKSYTRTVL